MVDYGDITLRSFSGGSFKKLVDPVCMTALTFCYTYCSNWRQAAKINSYSDRNFANFCFANYSFYFFGIAYIPRV